MSKCLFLGGPVDGQWIDIFNDPNNVSIYDKKSNQTMKYERGEFINGRIRYRAYILIGYKRTWRMK